MLEDENVVDEQTIRFALRAGAVDFLWSILAGDDYAGRLFIIKRRLIIWPGNKVLITYKTRDHPAVYVRMQHHLTFDANLLSDFHRFYGSLSTFNPYPNRVRFDML